MKKKVTEKGANGAIVVGGNSNPTTIKKRPMTGKNWVFTYNLGKGAMAPSTEGIRSAGEQLSSLLEDLCEGFIYQLEKGEKEDEDEGNVHFQGYVEFKKKTRPLENKDLKDLGIHWERRKGTKAEAINYSFKKNTRFEPTVEKWFWKKFFLIPRDVWCMEQKDFNAWQQRLWTKICELPDASNSRTIHWRWDKEGNCGKSSFAKWLVLKKKAMICGGKAADIAFHMKNYIEREGTGPEYVIVDIPRSNGGMHISYGSLEKLLDGMLFSSKYESTQLVFPALHLVVLANQPPDLSLFSSDRWDVEDIGETVLGVVKGHSMSERFVRSSSGLDSLFKQ